MSMRTDPIVDEIRRARQKHTDRHGADLHKICEDLRRQEQESGKQFRHSIASASRTGHKCNFFGLAVAVTRALSSQPTGWTDENRTKLDEYRHGASMLVAAAAAFTFPPEIPLSR